MKSIVSKVSGVFSEIGASFVNFLRLMHVISGVKAVKLVQETPASKAVHQALVEEFQAIVEANKPLAKASTQESSVDTTNFPALYFAYAKKNGAKVSVGVKPEPKEGLKNAEVEVAKVNVDLKPELKEVLEPAEPMVPGNVNVVDLKPELKEVLEPAEPIVPGKVAPRTWLNALTLGLLGHR